MDHIAAACAKQIFPVFIGDDQKSRKLVFSHSTPPKLPLSGET